MRRLTVFSIAVGVGLCSFGQSFHKNSWSYNLFLGGSSMLGDLGGGSSNGGFGVTDFDLRSVRPAIGIGTSYNMRGLSLGTNLLYTRLIGNDAFSQSESRSIRNLSVRTDLVELNVIGEIRPFGRNPVLKRMYLTVGVGGIFYQPKAKLNDEWIKLRPLGTEGQFINGSSTYSKLDVVIPYGVGYKFPLGESTTLNLDVGIRKTFTDYLDDVSTVYANNATLAELSGSTAATLADRSGLSLAEGTQRGGEKYNDSYFIVGLKFEKTIGGKQTSCFYDDVPISSKRRIKRHQRRMFRR
ncbi:MAG: hypothetical protein COA58_11205 [Bacteroidetes bacterium]|nr:MAG: hypothetical protein COA58_11205 [Bacteroidota bacterium]